MSGYRTINPKQPTEQCCDPRCENIYPHMAGLSCEIPKTDSSQAWTDECPHKADAGDEYYFVRRKDRNEVVVMGFSMGKAWLNGVSYEPSELRTHLFLGPLSPSDAELRRAAEQFVNAYQGKEQQLGNGQALRSFLRFRELLNPQPEKETQGK